MTGISRLSAADIATAYADRKLSPVEVTTALLDRIGRHDARINAFITLDRDGALAQARTAEAEILAGRTRGPLHGVPVAIKDIIDVAGLKTTCHSQILIDNVAREDAFATAKLKQAGAVIMGKLATWEFAIGGPSEDLPFPPAMNPWKEGHLPGGSSSGSGAALAARFVPVALGTDTGGSIRHPAAACGVIGLKPTYGLVSRRGVFPLAFTLDHVGPMARSVRDVALLLDGIAGHDPADASSVAVRHGSYAADLGRGVQGIRIGYVGHFHDRDMIANPDVGQALDEAAKTFQSLGAEVRSIEMPALQDFAAVNRIVLHSEAWSVHRKWLQTRPQDYGQIARRRLLSGAFIGGGDYVTAQRSRRKLIAAVNDALRDVDVLLTANALDPAGPLNEFSTGSPVNTRQCRTPFNVTGHPAMSLMSGLSRDGLPMSLQLVGRNFDERSLLRVASAFEEATGFHSLCPPEPGH